MYGGPPHPFEHHQQDPGLRRTSEPWGAPTRYPGHAHAAAGSGGQHPGAPLGTSAPSSVSPSSTHGHGHGGPHAQQHPYYAHPGNNLADSSGYSTIPSQSPPAPTTAVNGGNDGADAEASMTLAGLGPALLSSNVNVPPSAQPMIEEPASKRDGDSPRFPQATPKKVRKEGAKQPQDTRKSCAECRRLKAKCDRVFPCSNCRRRGCALVCPDGDLSCMQGKRLVLASTEQLHNRIAQLEAALFQAHSKIDAGSHPLLAPEYLDGGFASMPARTTPEQTARRISVSPALTDVKEDTMSSSPGSKAGSSRLTVEHLVLSDDVMAHESDWVSDNSTPAQFLVTPDAPNGPANVARLSEILAVLPPREEARRHAERFWVESGWYQHILDREEYETVYEPAVYNPTSVNPISPHKLSVVLIVLMLDSFFDFTHETEAPKVDMYWDAVQRCFDTRFGWAASVAGVQALGLISFFVGFGWKGARASNFYWVRRMTTAVQQLGMHKDPHPSIGPWEADFRRRIFWESFVIDGLLSINQGQRTAIPLENIECRYPNVDTKLNTRYEYMRRVNYMIVDLGLRPDSAPAAPDAIRVAEELHMKFEPSRVPALHCRCLSGFPMPEPSTELTTVPVGELAMTANSMSYYKCLLFLYRPPLRILVGRMRSNPDVKFSSWDRHVATMTMSTCQSAILSCRYFVHMQPRLAGRTWTTWVQVFSAAVSIAALAVWCSPYMEQSFLTQAYRDLEDVCQLITDGGSDRARGLHALVPVLQQMVAGRYPHLVGQDASAVRVYTESEDMLFALLGGAVTNYGAPALMATDAIVPFPSMTNGGQQQQRQQGQGQSLRPPQAPVSGTQTPRAASTRGGSGLSGVTGDEISPPVDWTQAPEMASNVDFGGYGMPNYMVIQQEPATMSSSSNNGGGGGGGGGPPPRPDSGRGSGSFPSSSALTTPPIADDGSGMVLPPVVAEPDPLSPGELWARLQTFYEPTVWWGLGDGYDVLPTTQTGNVPVTMATGAGGAGGVGGIAPPVFTGVGVPMKAYEV